MESDKFKEILKAKDKDIAKLQQILCAQKEEMQMMLAAVERNFLHQLKENEERHQKL